MQKREETETSAYTMYDPSSIRASFIPMSFVSLLYQGMDDLLR